MSKIRIITIQLMLLTYIINAQNTGYSDAFINIGASSRSIGLGQTVVALPKNIGGYVINPSATAMIEKNTINGMYVNQFEMAEYYTIGISHPTKADYKLGIFGINLSVDNIFERPDVSTIMDLEARRDTIRKLVEQGFTSFNTRESALFFNISKKFNKTINTGKNLSDIPLRIPIGLNIKLIHKDLYQAKGNGLGVDFGGMVILDIEDILPSNFFDEIVFGLSVTNIAKTTIYWTTDEKDNIPMQLIGGIGYLHKLDNLPIKYNLLWQKNSLYKDESQFGAEMTTFDLVNVRGGYNYGYLQGGIGLKFGSAKYSIGLDYSFTDHDLGNAHRIGGWVGF